MIWTRTSGITFINKHKPPHRRPGRTYASTAVDAEACGYNPARSQWVKNVGAKTERQVIEQQMRDKDYKPPPPPSRDVHKSPGFPGASLVLCNTDPAHGCYVRLYAKTSIVFGERNMSPAFWDLKLSLKFSLSEAGGLERSWEKE